MTESFDPNSEAYLQFQYLKLAPLPNGEIYAYRQVGSPNKPVLLLLHGTLATSVIFNMHAPKLALHFNVIAPDMRGFGNSSYNKLFQTHEELADDLKLFLDELKVTKCSVLGWAFGSLVAFHLAVKYPEVCDKVIFLETFGPQGVGLYKNVGGSKKAVTDPEEAPEEPINFKAVNDSMKSYNKEYLRKIFIEKVFSKVKPPEEFLDRALEDSLKARAYLTGMKANMTFNVTDEPTERSKGNGLINSLTKKTLIIHGADDNIIPIENAKLWKKFAKEGIVKECIITDAGHNPAFDKPDEVVNAITQFIAA